MDGVRKYDARPLMDRSDFAHAQGRRFAPLVRRLTRLHAAVYKRSKGRVGNKVSGRSVLVLTTTGAKTGTTRSVPLIYMPDDGRYLVVPSNSGADRPPGWWMNLQANPHAEVQIGAERKPVEASVVNGSDRAQLWDRAMEYNPDWKRCDEVAAREIPLVALEPR